MRLSARSTTSDLRKRVKNGEYRHAHHRGRRRQRAAARDICAPLADVPILGVNLGRLGIPDPDRTSGMARVFREIAQRRVLDRKPHDAARRTRPCR
ncbi:MAG: hypothetical protein MZV64_17115 [Ignavibacteriales bacterium]|nr:hypothetical protein [Ignavibacteriales bacterium]